MRIATGRRRRSGASTDAATLFRPPTIRWSIVANLATRLGSDTSR
jgi:hypothetical protein